METPVGRTVEATLSVTTKNTRVTNEHLVWEEDEQVYSPQLVLMRSVLLLPQVSWARSEACERVSSGQTQAEGVVLAEGPRHLCSSPILAPGRRLHRSRSPRVITKKIGLTDHDGSPASDVEQSEVEAILDLLPHGVVQHPSPPPVFNPSCAYRGTPQLRVLARSAVFGLPMRVLLEVSSSSWL
jgi:hypothetical protein